MEKQTPSDLKELIQIVTSNSNKLNPKQICAVGKCLSVSDINKCDGGISIDLTKLNRVLKINKKKQTVTVESGITLHELNHQIAQHGLSLPNQTAIDDVSIGGAISTACHGTGKTSSFSSFVKNLQIVLSDGSLKKIDSSCPFFNSFQTSLGLLGIIYSVTLQCEPLFYLLKTISFMDFPTFIQNCNDLYENNDHFQVHVNVHSDTVQTVCWNRCSQETQDSQPSYETLSFYKFDPNDKGPFSEFAIPIQKLSNVLKDVCPFLDNHCEFDDLTIRFVLSEKSLLSPSFSDNKNDVIVHLAFTSSIENSIHLFQELEDMLITKHNARPHWSKTNFLNSHKINFLYHSNYQQFLSVKKRVDPNNWFLNDLFINQKN